MTRNKDSTKYYSSKQEKQVANALGGKLVSGSGAPLFSCGDVELKDWLIECKTTMSEKKSFSIKKEWIDKNEIERMQKLKPYSAIAFNFEPNGNMYYVINEKLMKRLVNYLDNDSR